MSQVDTLLASLNKVRRTGDGRWIACCPAHQDKSPSMSIREVDDGRVLVHCFAGCSVEEILGAVGLSFDALFPEKVIENAKPLRRPFAAADVLECIQRELFIVALCAGDVAEGKVLPPTEKVRLLLAASRINEARSLALG